MLELENQALAGAELAQRFLDSPCQLAPHQVALGVRLGSRILHSVEEVARALFCLDDGRLFASYTAAAQVVEADVGDDTVKPRMKAALEAKAAQIAICLEKRFLVSIARVFLRAKKIQGQPEHTFVVKTHQLLEGVVISLLRRPDQC